MPAFARIPVLPEAVPVGALSAAGELEDIRRCAGDLQEAAATLNRNMVALDVGVAHLAYLLKRLEFAVGIVAVLLMVIVYLMWHWTSS